MSASGEWDLFCVVVDNFGDIGVTWRLARELSRKGRKVRIFTDRPDVLARIESSADPGLPSQILPGGTELIRWDPDTDFSRITPAANVVEMFACSLPDVYIGRMALDCLWINLEYLSAEDWVEGCHRMKSMEKGRIKYFFFPGFSCKTGGLNFEDGEFLDHPAPAPQAERFLQAAREIGGKEGRKPFTASVFTYRNPALEDLVCLSAPGDGATPVFIVPEGLFLEGLLASRGSSLETSDPDPLGDGRCRLLAAPSGNRILTVPMTDLDNYDALLRGCDFNFVRGEDSFVRAQLAGRPFAWNIYPQEREIHLVKLKSFLERYTRDLDRETAGLMTEFSMALNTGGSADLQRLFPLVADMVPTVDKHAAKWREALLRNGSLAANLITFADQIQKSYN